MEKVIPGFLRKPARVKEISHDVVHIERKSDRDVFRAGPELDGHVFEIRFEDYDKLPIVCPMHSLFNKT